MGEEGSLRAVSFSPLLQFSLSPSLADCFLSSLFGSLRVLPARSEEGMRLGSLAICGLICLAGCVAPNEDRWRFFNENGVQMFAKGEYKEALKASNTP
jgi:hypothetical protein